MLSVFSHGRLWHYESLAKSPMDEDNGVLFRDDKYVDNPYDGGVFMSFAPYELPWRYWASSVA